MNSTNQTEQSNSFSLLDYKQTVFKLSSILRKLRDFSEKLNLGTSIKLTDDVLQRLENNSFSIAVVGEFKRGKSTFINALLGQEILPSDILPTTATLNRVTYGLKPLVKIRFKDSSEEEIAIDQLTNYVTKLTLESETIAATVTEAVVYYPIPYCQNHVDIIDTPGLSDEENMSAVTLSVLPHVDAAILVIMAQSPFSESERAFLENDLLKEDLGRILFVVTGIDRCNTPEEAKKVVKTIEQRINEYLFQGLEAKFGQDSQEYKAYLSRIGQLKVFGISAYQALEAKHNGNPDLLNQSKFSEFEAALEKFLSEERGVIALQVPVNRAITSAKEILATISNHLTELETKKRKALSVCEAAVATAQQQQEAIQASQQQTIILDQLTREIRLQLNQLEDDLKQATSHVIDSTMLTPYDFNQSVVFERMLKCDRKLVEGLENHSRRLAGKIQIGLQRGLKNLEVSIQPSAEQTHQLLNNIGIEFINMAGLLKKSILEGKVAWRVSSSSTGGVSGWFNQKLRGNELVTSFKTNYKTAIFAEISKQLNLSPLSQQVYDSILATLEQKKSEANPSWKSKLNDIENFLAQQRITLTRAETLIDLKYQELNEMATETQNMLNQSQILSEKLMQI